MLFRSKAQSDQLLSETKAEAERRRVASQREVDELTRQKDNISTHLAQVRQLLGGQLGIQMPPMEPAVAAAPVQPAIAESVPAAAAPAIRPAGNGAAPAPRPNGAANGDGKGAEPEDWWTE